MPNSICIDVRWHAALVAVGIANATVVLRLQVRFPGNAELPFYKLSRLCLVSVVRVLT